MGIRVQTIIIIGLITALGGFFGGCNLFGTFDPPDKGTKRERYLQAMTAAESGDCNTAKDILRTIDIVPDDDVKIALGWAYVCMAGATGDELASTLYQYSSGNPDVTTLGNLARAMIPSDEPRFRLLQEGLLAFAAIRNLRVRFIEMGIGKLIEAASILASQAANDGSSAALTRKDIDPVCSATCTSCSNSLNAISDADIERFRLAISDAAVYLGNSDDTHLKQLPITVRNGIAQGSAVGRCYIYSVLIPAGT